MYYLQVLIALATYAATHPKEFAVLWQAIVEAWQAAVVLKNTVIQQFSDATNALPVARDLEIAGAAAEVADAEDRLERALAELPQPRASTRAIFNVGKGNLRKIIGELIATPIGKVLLEQLLTKIGGVGS